MNTAQSQIWAVSLSFYALQIQHYTHPVSSEAIDQLFGAKVSLSFFSGLTANKTRKCARDYGPGCNLKALYLWENKRLPADLLPSRPPPPPSPRRTPGTCGSLFKDPHQGLWRPQTGAENMKGWKRNRHYSWHASLERIEGKEKEHFFSLEIYGFSTTHLIVALAPFTYLYVLLFLQRLLPRSPPVFQTLVMTRCLSCNCF